MELYIYWLLQISSVSSIFIWNYALLKYYTDPHETVKVTLFIQVLAFSSVMIYILLIPFDVFATVRHHDVLFEFTDPLLHHHFNVKIYDLYFICYVGMIFLCFIWLPFSYFYAQSVQEEDEMILEAAMTSAAKFQGAPTEAPAPGSSRSPDGGQEKTCKLKGMDSSESQSDEDETPNTIGSKAASESQAPAKRDEFTQDMDPEFGAGDASRGSFYGQQRQLDIKHSSKKSAFQKFLDHSKRAIKKTVASFICLAFMLLMSFVVSSYEYNNVHDQYQRVYEDVAKKLAHAHSGRKNSTVHQNATIARLDSASDLASTELPEDWRNQSLGL